jgi:dienelactone hydrolase
MEIKRFIEPIGAAYDEVGFRAATRLIQLRKPKPHHSDKQALENLLKWSENPDLNQVFPTPPMPDVKVEPTHRPYSILGIGKGYYIDKIEWQSAYPLGYPENDKVTAWYCFRMANEDAPTLIYCHGWMSPEQGLSMRLPLNWAEGIGANLLFIELPFHMNRTPKGSYNGELSISGDLPAIVEGARQAVTDVRSGISWLESKGVEKIGIIGKSMGGNIAALVTAADKRLTCSLLIVPAVGVTKSLWNSSYATLVREELKAQEIDEALTAKYVKLIDPNAYQPAIASEQIMTVIATADRACFYPDVCAFAEKWHTEIITVPYGHFSAVLTNYAKTGAQKFMQKWLEYEQNV